MKAGIHFTCIILLLFAGCKEEYDLDLKSADQSLLVVEGILNANGPTTITISRSLKIEESVQFKPVLNAQLSVEGKDNSNTALLPAGAGKYAHPNLALVIGNEYRLRIKTNGEEFLSGWVITKSTPAIDSITWERVPEGLKVFVSTHDLTGESRYYKWDFDETWQINSFFPSDYKWIGDSTIIPTPANEYTYSCWKYGSSSNLILGSSAQLQADVISQLPAYHIPLASEKLSVRYSPLFRQYSLTKQAYEYLQLMKKNTESLGTIFDPQPSELRGNISNVADPAEIVIGYVSASTVTEKRIFITSTEASWTYPQDCSTVTIKNHPDTIKKYVPLLLPYGAIEHPSILGLITDYLLTTPQCVDCTLRGGSLVKPGYW